MRIFLASDIHPEFAQDYRLPVGDVDLVIINGDCGIGTDCLSLANWYQLEAQVPVVIVAGNHEFYGGDFVDTLKNIRQKAAEFAKVYFLENDAIVIDGVRFLGCTLWSNFQLYGKQNAPDYMANAKWAITDFRVIQHGDRRLSPYDIAARFEQSYSWLDQELAKPFDGETVVLTHFAPHRAAIHPRFTEHGTDPLTPYFSSDCSALMRKHQIKLWCYGHTHNSVDRLVEQGTRLVSNQSGYPNEQLAYTQFDPDKIIII